MATEKINPFEQHVEKIVLAVAAAGALYLGYLAIQPVTIEHGGNPVSAGRIEEVLANEIQGVEGTKAKNESTTPPTPRFDFAERYQNLVKLQPLDPKLLAAAVPPFAPAGPRIGKVEDVGGDRTYQLVTPTPAAPEGITTEVRQQPVANISPGEQQPPQVAQGQSLPTHDISAVLIQGYIPVGAMRAEMVTVKDPKEQLPASNDLNLRQIGIYRVEVRRSERKGGGWSDWTLVPATKASQAPSEINWEELDNNDGQARRIEDVNREIKQILLPDFYYDSQGQLIQAPILTKTPPAARVRELQAAENKANGIATPVQPAGRGQPVRGATPAGEVAEGVDPAAPTTPDSIDLKTQQLVPFAFWDETVEAGHEYRYEVRVRYVNPVYKWGFGLKNPAMGKLATLDSQWVPAQGAVTVNADIAFYVMSGGTGRGASTASFRVFKHTNGRWYQGSADVPIGGGVLTSVRMPDRQPPQQEVDTGWRVVDVAAAGNDTRVVLVDGNGRMMTRDASADRNDPNNESLQKAAQAPITPPAGAAGTEGTSIDPQATPAGRGNAGRGTTPPARNPQPTPAGTGFVDPRSRMR